jgi:CRISPR-associated exonuclease Cas4
MLSVGLSESAFFYGTPRRRHVVNLGEDLRRETRRLAVRLHEIIGSGKTPPPEYTPGCQSCSLVDVCLPKAPRLAGTVERYLKTSIDEVLLEETA